MVDVLLLHRLAEAVVEVLTRIFRFIVHFEQIRENVGQQGKYIGFFQVLAELLLLVCLRGLRFVVLVQRWFIHVRFAVLI